MSGGGRFFVSTFGSALAALIVANAVVVGVFCGGCSAVSIAFGGVLAGECCGCGDIGGGNWLSCCCDMFIGCV